MDKLKSRKFWITIIAIILLWGAKVFTGEISAEAAVIGTVTVVLGYLASQGLVDAKALGIPDINQSEDKHSDAS